MSVSIAASYLHAASTLPCTLTLYQWICLHTFSIYPLPNSECQLVNTIYCAHSRHRDKKKSESSTSNSHKVNVYVYPQASIFYLGIGYWHFHFAHHLSIHLFPSSKSENRRDIFSPFFGCSFCCQPASHSHSTRQQSAPLQQQQYLHPPLLTSKK